MLKSPKLSIFIRFSDWNEMHVFPFRLREEYKSWKLNIVPCCVAAYSKRHNHTVYSNTPRQSEVVTPYSMHITRGPVEEKHQERGSFLLHFLLHLMMANFSRNMSWTILRDEVLLSSRPINFDCDNTLHERRRTWIQNSRTCNRTLRYNIILKYYMHLIGMNLLSQTILERGKWKFWHMVKSVHGATKGLRTTAL
jgi:hypothetical protein